MNQRASLLLLGGPTSAGKTSVALEIAQRNDAVIVSADAMQVYRGMDVGTGKVTREEMDGVPHFGINIRNPDELFDLGDFIELADAVIREHDKVIIVGGTSLYLRGVVRGLVNTPAVVPSLRAELEASDGLHEDLKKVDPVLAERLHPNDKLRIIRGLEVFKTLGRPLSDLHKEHSQAPDRYEYAGYWLDRSDLKERINNRVLQMVEDGYVEETKQLLDQGYQRGIKPMMSLGYRHMCTHLLDGVSLERAVEMIQRDTRRFARKQRNWLTNLSFDKLVDNHDKAARYSF